MLFDDPVTLGGYEGQLMIDYQVWHSVKNSLQFVALVNTLRKFIMELE